MNRTFTRFLSVFLAALLLFSTIDFLFVNSGNVAAATGSAEEYIPPLTDDPTAVATVEIENYDTLFSNDDFVISAGVLTAYTGAGGVVIIPAGVVEIAANVFLNKSSITGVVFNDGLQRIGHNAFRGCTGLTGSLEIPGSVTSIGDYAFDGCTGLNGTLTLNHGIQTIGYYAFQNCNRLTGDLIIPNSVTGMGYGVFQNCAGFNGRLQLSENLTSISSSTFASCTNITGELVIPDRVTNIDFQAFQNMRGLTSVVFGEGVRQI